MKFQQRPSIIDAERADQLIYWFNHEPENLPNWFADAIEAADIGDIVIAKLVMTIQTPAGRRTCTKDHMVIHSPQAGLSLLRVEIFEIIYEEAG